MSKSPPSSSRTGVGCLVIFALPFALGGAAALFIAVYPVYRSFMANSWVEVPARILAASVDSSHGSESTSYKLIGRYEYEVNGERYQSDRMTFYSGHDNIDSFHHDKLSALRPYLDSGTLFHAYVNPEDPEDSVLFREFRWSSLGALSLFGLVFSGAGWGIILAAIVGNARGKDRDRLLAAHPQEPWLHDPAWAKRRVTCGSKASVVVFSFVVLIWNGISAFLPFMIWEELMGSDPNYAALAGLVFPLIGLGLLYALVVKFVRWRRFGNSELILTNLPYRIGGEFKATLVASRHLLEAARSLNIQLSCHSYLTKGSGKNRTTQRSTVAEARTELLLTPGMSRMDKAHLPITLSIPSAGLPTSEPANPSVRWDLTCDADIPGADFHATFQVPIF